MEETIFTLPITEPVAFFAVMLGIMFLVPMLAERLRLPGLVGLLLAGVVIGPHGLHIVSRSNSVVLLATIGLLYVMFIAGLELDMAQFKKYRQRSVFLAAGSFLIPQALGTLAGLWFGFGWLGSLLLGAVLASHTLLAYPIISRMGLSKQLSVTTAVGSTILVDLLALLVLAVVAAAAHGQLDAWFWARFIGSLCLYGAGVIWGVPRLARAFFKNVGTQPEREFMFVLAVMFGVSLLAKVAGIEAILGAFLAGLMLNRFLPEHSPLLNRVQFVGNAVFIPFFLLATGMLVDLRVLASDASVWLFAGVMTAIVVAGKLASSWATGAWYGYSKAERLTMFGLTMPHAAATLAATLTGQKLGLFSVQTVNGVIVMILVTCVIGPALVQRFGREMAIDSANAPERIEQAPERILVPFSTPESKMPLLDLAVALRSGDNREPIFPLMVARADAPDSGAKVAEAEKHLAQAAAHLADAEVPAVPLARVGLNVASVISQAAIDTRSSIVVMAWNGDHSLKDRVFGSVIDQVLEHELVTTLVARPTVPLVTLSEVVLLVPPMSARHPGFEVAIAPLKRLVSRLGANLVLWTVGPGSDELVRQVELVEPRIPLSHVGMADWREAVKKLRAQKDPDTLTALLSAREGDLSWQPFLSRLPQLMADAPGRSFLVVYPAELTAPGDSLSPLNLDAAGNGAPSTRAGQPSPAGVALDGAGLPR